MKRLLLSFHVFISLLLCVPAYGQTIRRATEQRAPFLDNFVANPDAWVGTASVTASGTGATIARNATTPLGDISDFAYNLGSTTSGYVEYAVRTLPLGMTNQNCVAVIQSLTLSVGVASAQIQVLQNSVVVGSIAITPSTTALQYAINVPCGSGTALSTTKIRIAQTAYTSGTTSGNAWGVSYGDANKYNRANVSQITAWQAYIPTVSGFTGGSFEVFWRQNGDSIDVQGRFASTSPVGSAVQFGLPLNYTIAYLTSTSTVGKWIRNNSAASVDKTGTVLAAAGNSYLTFGSDSYTAISPLSSQNGSAIWGGEAITFFARGVPIVGLTAQSVITPNNQNQFAGGQWTGGYLISVTSGTNVLVTGLSSPTSLGIGTAASTSAAVTVNGLATGEYDVEAHFQMDVVNSQVSSGLSAACAIGLSDDNGTTVSFASQQTNITSVSGIGQRTSLTSVKGVFKYTSPQSSKTFGIYVRRAAGSTGATCEVYAPITLTIRPSNAATSALFIQAPTKADTSGIAPASDKVGYKFDGVVTATSGNASGAVKDAAKITALPTGTWILFCKAYIFSSTASAITGSKASIGTVSNTGEPTTQVGNTIGTTESESLLAPAPRYVTVAAGATQDYFCTVSATLAAGTYSTDNSTSGQFYGVRLN